MNIKMCVDCSYKDKGWKLKNLINKKNEGRYAKNSNLKT